MRDLSEAGVCLLLAEPLEVGLAVEIQLDGIPHRQAVKIPGKVVWLNPTSDGRFLIGLQFDTLLPRMDLLAMARV